MNRLDCVKGLREIADFLEAHPECESDYYVPSIQIPNTYSGTEERTRLALIARAFGRAKKQYTGEFFYLKKYFHAGAELWTSAYREAVCRRITKTVIVPAQPAKPAIPEHEETITEWDCAEPILSPIPGELTAPIQAELPSAEADL